MIRREKKSFMNWATLLAIALSVNTVPTTALAIEDKTNVEQPIVNEESNLDNSSTKTNSSINDIPAISAISELDNAIAKINEVASNDESKLSTLSSSSANLNYSIEGNAIVGNSITISINADSVSNLYGASIDFLYDTNVLEIESVSIGSIFAGKITRPLISKVENGQVNMAMSLTGAATPISGSGSLATIRAKVLKPGTINLKTTDDYSKLSLDSYTTCIKLSDNTGNKMGFGFTDKTFSFNPSSLEPGFYQENDTNITYIGKWNSMSSNNYSGGSLKLSTTANSTMEFSFTGTSFELYGTKAISRGKFKVTIDGVDVDTVDAYRSSTAYTQSLYKSSELKYGKHTVKITVLDTKNPAATSIGIDIDKLNIYNNPVIETLNSGTYQENNNNILYKGSWNSMSSNNYDGGSLKLSTTANSTMEFSFNGTSFELYGTKAISRGKFKVTIDGVDVDTVDAYNSSTSYKQLLYKSKELTSTKHTVKITVLDSKNSAATAIGLDIDKLVINNDIIPTETLSAGVYQENDSKILYAGNWNSLSSSNYSGGSLKLTTTANSTMSFNFDGTSFELFGTKAITRGKFKVTIDGVDVATVDAYKNSTSYTQSLYKSQELKAGKHTVKITVLDSKNSAATAIGLDIDKLVINNDIVATETLGTGTYQENNSKIIYNGTWSSLSSNNYDGGSLKLSTTANSTMTFAFNGTSFELYGTKAISRGKFKVTIDGVDITTVDAYNSSTSYTQLLYKSQELDYGKHTVKITVLDTKNPSATAFGLDIDKLVINDTSINNILMPGSYEENNSKLEYEGNWSSLKSNNYSGGTLKLSTAANSSVSFTFTGTSFDLYGTKAISRGKFKVNIDGVDVDTVDAYNSSTAYTQLLYKSKELEYGNHTVKITVLNTKNSAATDIGLDIDKLIINNTPLNGVLNPGTYQDSDSNIKFNGNWQLLSSNNYSGGTLKLTSTANSTVSFKFKGTSFELYGTKAISRGNFKVNIDGVDVDTVDAYRSSTAYTQLLYKSKELAYGEHNVTITVLNTKNSAATSIGLDIDKIAINSIRTTNPLGIGSYQENNVNIQYTGTWSSLNNKNYDGGSLKLTTLAGSTMNFAFNGTSFELYGTKAISRGKFKVSIDGKDMGTVDAYNNSTVYTQLLYKSPELTAGNHTVTITVLNEKNPAATAIGLDIDKLIIKNVQPDNILQPGTYQDNNNNLKYTGTWSSLSNSKYDGGSLKISTAAGSTMSFSFNGTSFELYGTKAISRGKFKVTIDGKDIATVDAYNNSTIYTQLLYRSPELTAGNHTVTITVLNEKNPAATAIGLDIDKIII